ncbi:hypothetical protein [Cellulophaga baltica]|uniref:hypothetical protein n=1 Tax=Cellulophaga baltica TaxID=76594 RepID=UPI00249553A0|nr:hypothetical protein [Cellulophaga baltica]
MTINLKTLEKLRLLINEETEYRSGPKLVAFFNSLGFNDSYGKGFPSRKDFTDDKLNRLNGTADLDKAIKSLFAPVNFISRYSELDQFISQFNEYLAFDGWQVIRDKTQIKFKKAGEIDFEKTEQNTELKEDEFLNREFEEVKIELIGLDGTITEILNLRFEEIKKCLSSNAPLSVIFMCGSTLEGILLGIAMKRPREFNTTNSSPKNQEGKVKPLHEWTLNNLINTAYELRLIKEDVKKFSHSLRDFRNYIHPFQQLSSRFNPDKHTAKISWQVLKTAIYQLGK